MTLPRRRWLGASALSALLAACKRGAPVPEAGPSLLGATVRAYGERSPFETAKRSLDEDRFLEASQTRTPLGESVGILTPSSLHYERHHSGVPRIDPAQHRLLIHGMVERPIVFTVEDLRRLPSVSRIHFLECSGNTGVEWAAKPAPTAQMSHGLASCSEWTGVPLALLLAEAGVQPGAKWIVAEGADACKMQRSLPLAKAMDDMLVAWGQNGEPLRPEQGYPLRLFVPGWEGNVSVKWLRRILVAAEPTMARDETAKYTDLMADGTARMFTFAMEAKSLITYPSGGQRIKPGFCEITGLAWSGAGLIRRVEVSTDGGASWLDASLQQPVLPKAFTRFRLPWKWQGGESTVQSRCTDETGYVQPSRDALETVRGAKSTYHYNGVKSWKIAADGSVSHV
ncbi:MAG TPA: sulfite dehydrogenase [Candidatus Sulfopaludibacter sp.]|jgi:sulfane dehydrogenase subunit SoxC|nr:sulfite dehydrogenase [Candidatus Sulfopaludibacter sp.]